MMKWYAIPALLTFGLNSMLAAIIVCLATFHLYTDKSTNPPIEPNREWIRYVKFLLPFAVCWMVISIGAMYVCMAKRRIICATWLLAFYAICLGLSIYFTLVFSKQLEGKEVEAAVLFKTAIDEIQEHNQDAWIPAWLDNIQKQSKHCCGINTYHDYEKLWVTTPSRVPKSCCKELKSNQGPCPSDLTLIPFPRTPADYIKVETGCTEDILASIRHHIQETFQNCVTSSIVIGLGLLAFMVLYTKRYLFKEAKPLPLLTQAQKMIGGGDARDLENSNENTSEPFPMTSSSVGLVDSMDGVQPFGSIVSMTGPNPEQYLLQQTSATMLAQIQQQQQLQQLQLEQLKQQQLLQQFQQQQMMQPSQLFHQQPQMMDAQMMGANTGSFVFNNPGRREPFIAQSGMIPTVSAAEEQSSQPPVINPRSTPPYPDNVTITNRSEQQAAENQSQVQAPTSPPGSPGLRYKKVRREAIANRRKDSSK